MASSGLGQESFGRVAAQVASVEELLELERDCSRADYFLPLDSLIGSLAIRVLRGETPFSVKGIDETGASGRPASLHLAGLTSEERCHLEEFLLLEKQRSRGTWSLPESVHARLGRLHFPAHLKQHGRFFHESVESDTYRSVTLASSPEALLAHAILDPFFSLLYEPFALCSGRAFSLFENHSLEKLRDRRLTRWQTVDAFLSALGLKVEAKLSILRPGGDWYRLRAAEQLAAKVELAEAIRLEAERLGSPLLGARYRAYRLRPLLEQYYSKANKEGRALRRRVLTRKFEINLSSFFGGDWLAFLDYLEEKPHPEEHIATALPETRLYLGSSSKTVEHLGVQGVSEKQLMLIAASLYGGETSPSERRIRALKRYWEAFDAIHARQKSGMEPLWGLVEEDWGFPLFRAQDEDSPYREGIYRRLLPDGLVKEIDELWGTSMLPREPGRIVTEPFPHALMAKAFGPALRFWHGCALTAWFLCEGPYSRTDMAGLEHYHRRELAELEDLGAPIDRKMFTELIAAEEDLGPEEPIYEEAREIEIEPGLIVESSTSRGSRREGFKRLRDIVTKYRRAWAQEHLDSYLKARVEGDVKEAARTYHSKTAERGGKPPTPKQFARTAAGPTNRWLGGDVSALYRVFGERSPVSPEYVRLLPTDVESFVRRVYSALGGVELGPYPRGYDQQRMEEHSRKIDENYKKSELTNMVLDYLRLEEALGRAPTLKEFGKNRFAHLAEAVLGVEVEEAWNRYISIVRDALASDKTEIETVGKIESREQGQPSADEHFSDDGPEQELAHHLVSEFPEAEAKVSPRVTGKKPWWRRILGS